MKKIILFLALLSLGVSKAQVVGGYQNTALLNKIDTTTKAFVFEIYTTATYSANCAITSTNSVKSFSMDLGSQYWKLVAVNYIDAGGNYGLNTRLLMLSDTISVSDNTIPTSTSVRSRKALGAFSLGTGVINTNPAFTSNAYINASVISPIGFYTGTIYFLPIATNQNNSNGQKLQFRFLFQKIKD